MNKRFAFFSFMWYNILTSVFENERGKIMAYVALYRSYRPSSFKEVIGQKHVVQTLKNAVMENKTSHAYIFSGLRGIGKTTIARIFAKAVNCENQIDGEPCNHCKNCLAIINNETTDIVELDAASNNGVDEMREILEKVNFLPSVLRKKVYIIDEAHMLSTAAFNALLKTLEEPPSHVIFILATTEPHKIPATILSRCQRFDFKQFTLEELKEEMISLGEKPYRAEQIFKWIYKDKVKEFDEMTNLSIELREKLQQNYTMCNFKILKKQESSDGTKKYLFDVLDGNAIETVLMQYHHGKTICVSSQIGCKMGCKFCASTGINFVRNLTSGEIVEQIVAVEQDIGEEISNIVFMGIGEPLDNFDNVIKAIKIMNNPKGLNIGGRHISISTCGVVPKIYELANQKLQCTLSISLHATNNNKRSSMMPINNRYQIEELIKACKDYIKATNKRVSFEYALAKDNNDNLEDAKELVKLLKGMICHVNLIPINKIENGEFSKSTNENIIKFRDYLNEHGIVATIRRELGSDIDAACGQLRRKEMKKE